MRRHQAAGSRPWVTAGLGVWLIAVALTGCLLDLEEQKRHIRANDLPLKRLTPQAFLDVWGAPTYQYESDAQFYPVADGQYVPSFRVPAGEVPRNWNASIVSGTGRFLAYPDRGELLGFLANRLVYRERLPAAQLHSLGATWAREDKLRTSIERDLLKPR